MTSDEILSELRDIIGSPNTEQKFSRFYKKITKLESTALRDAMLAAFRSPSYPLQQAAGGILWKAKTSYDRNLVKDLIELTPNWNVSVEELPWYLAEMTDIEELRKTAESLLGKANTAHTDQKLESILWWLSAKDPDVFREKLTRSWDNTFT